MVIRVERFRHGRVLGMMNIPLQMLVVALARWVAAAHLMPPPESFVGKQAAPRGARQPLVTAAYTSS